MKIEINVKGMDATIARLRGLAEKKINQAAAAALNDAARAGYEAVQNEMRGVFDKPTPWVLGGARYIKARPDRLYAIIDFDKWGNKTGVTVEKVLQAQINGGQRRNKRHEAALQRAGILPPGMLIVPGAAAEMDAYGNMKGGQIVQIMAWFKSHGEQGYKANMTDKTRARLGNDKKGGQKGFAYFVLHKPHGKLLPGIYKRFTFGHGSSVRPVMIFVRAPAYSRHLDFYGIAKRAADGKVTVAFKTYLNQMLKERGL